MSTATATQVPVSVAEPGADVNQPDGPSTIGQVPVDAKPPLPIKNRTSVQYLVGKTVARVRNRAQRAEADLMDSLELISRLLALSRDRLAPGDWAAIADEVLNLRRDYAEQFKSIRSKRACPKNNR